MVFAWKSLADGQLPNAKGTLYTVPASTQTAIKQITLVNTGGGANAVNLYIKRSGSSSRRILPMNMNLDSGSAVYWGDEDETELTVGDVIEGDATNASQVDYVITGAER